MGSGAKGFQCPGWIGCPAALSVIGLSQAHNDLEEGHWTHAGEYKDFLYEPTVQLFPNGTIFFKKISKESQGHFLCEAKNTIGSGVSKVIFLKVNGKDTGNIPLIRASFQPLIFEKLHFYNGLFFCFTPLSACPLPNEDETDIRGQGQAGPCAVQRAGRQSHRLQMENTGNATVPRRVTGFPVRDCHSHSPLSTFLGAHLLLRASERLAKSIPSRLQTTNCF